MYEIMLEKSDLIRSIILLIFLMISIIIIISPYVTDETFTYAIIAEIWIAVSIAMIVYHFSKKTEEHNKSTLRSIENMIKIQFTEDQWVKNEARFKIIHDFNRILEISENIIRNSKKLKIENSDEEGKKLKNQIITWQKELSLDAIKNLESNNVVSTNFFSFYEIQHIKLIVQQCKIKITFDDKNKKTNYHHLESLQTFLPNTIKKYEEEMLD